MTRLNVHVSLACWPGMRHDQAAQHLAGEVFEPLFGRLCTDHVQLVPQSFGVLTDAMVDDLKLAFPRVRFRLHANVRVLPEHHLADLSGFQTHSRWFRQAARISQRLAAPAYTAHAGLRRGANMTEMLDNARRCADLFGCVVGVEGQYPAEGDPWLVSNWPEYRQLFDSGVPYAIDLSHLHILACHSGIQDNALVHDMLACDRCIEVHVSANDGRGDWHQVCQRPPWWWPLLQHINPNAVIFSEGNHRRRRTS